MRFKRWTLTWLMVFCCCSASYAQEFNQNQQQSYNPYTNANTPTSRNPYDTNYGSSTTYNPFTQDSRLGQGGNNPYGQTNYDANQSGQFDQNNRQNPYDTNRQNPYDSNRQNPYDTNRQSSYDTNRQNQYDPNNQYGKNDQYSGFTQRPRYESGGYKGNQIDFNPVIKEASYFVVASRMVRPGQLYRVSVTVLQEKQPLTVRASIQRDGVEVTSDHKDVKVGIPETLLMKMPTTSVKGEYNLRVEGLYQNLLGGSAFINETRLTFSQRSLTIFIQMDKPVYMQGEKVRFRVIPINTELRAFDSAIDVFMLNPDRVIMKRWLSRYSNLGTVSLDYQLSDLPTFGDWTIQAIAQGQVEESTFSVEEYYQTRFEVNITMPAFFFSTDQYVHGIVMANYTSGVPVRGNLTLKATIRPIRPVYLRPEFQKRNRPRNEYEESYYGQGGQYAQTGGQYGDQYGGSQYGGSQYGNNEYGGQYGGSEYGPNNPNNPRTYSDNRGNVEKYFNFDEEYPFWFNVPEHYYDPIPHLKFFNGVYHFKYPMSELLHYAPTLEGMEIVLTATVGDRFLDEVIEGHSIARVYNSSIKVSFLGDSPQVFKPGMAVRVFMVASFHDGSALSDYRLKNGRMEVQTSIEMRGGGRREIATKELKMSDKPGVWEYFIDLKDELSLQGQRTVEEANDVSQLRINANFRDVFGERAIAELLMLAHYSPENKQLKISTSTTDPAVGEYIIFHISSNYYVEKFNYIIISKGIILLTGDEVMEESICTMAIPLSADMAPVATIVVWHVEQYGDVMADSLTFPINGISRNKFSVFINNKKARTGHKVEVAVYGEPGSYVGLSGIDKSFYTMQAGNELTYSTVIQKMASFDEQTNGTHSYTWTSHEGDPDDFVYFPSSTYGIDANSTFNFVGLVVFSDIELPRRFTYCNISQGYGECLSGRCYRVEKRCDGFADCEDGTDESGCPRTNATELAWFRKYRFNRIQRQYENVWVWEDINIGPHGRAIFNIDVPPRPVHWMISGFSMSPNMGFGMLTKPIEYMGVLPFFINVEVPSICMQGEQVGVRVSVFNYMMTAIEATVVLQSSHDYKFVHVEEDGIVRSYNPRTSYGEHQFFIFIEAQDAEFVYIPIVPTRLGEIEVTIYASALIGKDIVTKKIKVEADGVPQYRHQSMLLDLSSRAYAFQYMHVNITETPIIPYEYDRYYVYGSNKARVSIVGDVVGAIFPTMPINATSLLHMPVESAEANIFAFAANMYTTLYMRYVIQRNRTLERQAFQYMNIGYQKQLAYMQPDGSFSLFRTDWNQSEPSVWLTAYVTRLFQEATFNEWENFIYIDPTVIAKSVSWILDHQSSEGAFYETTWSPDRKYNQSTRYPTDPIRQRNITLTAHVLITLEAVKDLSSGLSSRVSTATSRAVQWLDRNMNLLQNHGTPFEIAIVAYALIKTKAHNAEAAFNLLVQRQRFEGGLMYWARESLPQPPYKLENQKPFLLPRLPYKYDSENIEATSYALLVCVIRQEIYVDNIVRWLNTQRLQDGGWASTMDTAHAMKALIAYTAAQRIRDVSQLSVTVDATALPGQSRIMHITDANRGDLQAIDIPEAWGTVKVQAKGTGYAILQMHVQYNVDITKFQTQPPVPAFDLWTRADYFGRNHSHISFISCQKWTNLNESERSGLTVLDITIPTGYIIQQQKLDAYILSRRVRNLQRAKFLERKVLFYFDYLDNQETCINLTVERWYPVANMSRFLPIRVYDYYAPERFNETIFDALATYVLNICEVCGSSQCPYCSIYNAAVMLPIPVATLLATSIFLIVRYLRTDLGVII